MSGTGAGAGGVVGALDRIHARRILQRIGVVGEPTGHVASDSREVTQLLGDRAFQRRLAELAGRLERDPDGVRAEAAGYLREMSATHDDRPTEAWRKFTRWFLRAYDVYVDDDQIARLRRLDRKNSLAFAFSHRSYLDGLVVPDVVASRGMAPPFTFGGANLNFFPMGTWVSHSGMIFIRRQTKDLPVYRTALRAYTAQLVRNRANVTWSIEGGRTRTGKLRPPVYGILRYLIDALEQVTGPDVLLVPVSVVYDQLHEVSLMTSEARGGVKRPEDLRWLVRLARQQRERLGRAYLDFGEPLPLRERLRELRAEEEHRGHEVERIALDVSHRINRATPVTATAVVSLAALGADRALTLAELLATVQPLASYIRRRNWQVAGAADLTDRATIRRTLQELVASAVLTCYDGGTEPVWGIASEQHLVAAFYRNTAIHILVDRAIAELALQTAAESGTSAGGSRGTVLDAALRLRELLKFEFFFAARSAFEAELSDELGLMGATVPAEPSGGSGGRSPGDVTVPAKSCTPADAARLLRKADLLLAHLVLRPYLDAYHIVAEQLADLDSGDLA
ncbi:MAG: lysophospholipid acyltransferase, partial [Thermocrispum sp.]